MSTSEVVRSSRHGAVALVELNRPEALNAFDHALRAALARALADALADPAVRAIVLTGAGRAFSAGADLKVGPDGASGARTRQLLEEEYRPSLMAIVESPKPVIAAVSGVAAGIGCAYVLASDLVVMGESACLTLPFSSIALVPDGGLTWLLAHALGHRLAFQFAAEAERIPAARCAALGLANQVVADAEVRDAALRWAARLAARPALALAHTKRLLREAPAVDFRTAFSREAEVQAECVDSPDFAEGVRAFLEKRAPRFGER
jgi:2-(1,2-epoxy-1,2-dihydrophenyl)acetyl-CoA isomerase